MPTPLDLPGELAASLRSAVEFAGEQLERTVRDWPPERPAPVHTRDGKWYRPTDLWTDWTPGFLAGQLWILHSITGEERWRELAIAHTERLAGRRFDRDVHDLGFIFLSSYGRWLDALPPDDPMRGRIEDVLVTAGTVQSFRWNEIGPHGYIYSFNGPQSLFIDVMMNVRLLFLAHRLGADEEVLMKAIDHCYTTARYLVRSDGEGLGEIDGSVAHEAIFNTEPLRGEFRCLSTQQGYSPFTCWSRGLAWAIYGFAEAFRYTGERDLLVTAERCARYWLDHTPGGVPPWDHGAPGLPDEPLDSSAAAIAGCGLDILAGLAPADRRPAYRDASRHMASVLASPAFLARGHAGEEGVLLHGVYHRPRGWGVDASVMWGDYFFLELCERCLGGAGKPGV